MKEIEILVKVTENNVDKIINELNQKSSYIGRTHVRDIYYFDKLRNSLKPDENYHIKECFRLRKKGNQSYLTYKIDNFSDSGEWLYSDEDETLVENFEIVNQIIKHLGLSELITVDMEKYFFETQQYNISLEIVKNLGIYLEVESKNMNCKNIDKERQLIQDYIDSLNIKTMGDAGAGKPELLLKKYGYKH